MAPLLLHLQKSGAGSNIQAQTKAFSDRKFRFWYELKVKELPASSKQIAIWLPLPQSNQHQKISDLEIRSDYPYSLYKESEYGNFIFKLEASSKLPESLLVSLSFVVTRTTYSAFKPTEARPGKISDPSLKRFLSPDRLVPTAGIIKQLVDSVEQAKMTDWEKARAIYDYVVNTMSYDKGGQGWGRGDAVYACQVLKGNCTDFHSLFIGMARAGGIPARFVIGFPVPQDRTKGEISGYHCWAEFYTKERGWVPVDASEANQHPQLREFYFGNLDPSRVEFTVGRDLQIDPQAKIDPLNYFIYPYLLVDGKEYQEVETKFRFADLTFSSNP